MNSEQKRVSFHSAYRKARKKDVKTKIFIPQTLLVGELIPWKGYFWKLVAGSPDGGEVTLKDSQGKETKGFCCDAVVVFERGNETTQHLKKADRTKKWNRQHVSKSKIVQ